MGLYDRFKDGSLPLVWQEFEALISLDTQKEHQREKTWQGRSQIFRWVNGIEYEYGPGKRKKVLTINVVTCDESWEERYIFFWTTLPDCPKAGARQPNQAKNSAAEDKKSVF